MNKLDKGKTILLSSLLCFGIINGIKAQINNSLKHQKHQSAREYNKEQQRRSTEHYQYTPPTSRNITATPSLKNQLNITANSGSPDIFINNEITKSIGDTVIYIQTLGSRDPASLIYTINSIVIKTGTDAGQDIIINSLNIPCTTSGPIKIDEEIAVFRAILASNTKDSLPTKVIEYMQGKVGEKKGDEAEGN